MNYTNSHLTVKPKPNTGFFRFFLTPRGRKLVFFAAGTTTIGLFAINFLPQTVGLDYYKNFVQCYQNGVEWPVKEHIQQRLQKAMDILELREYEKLIVKPFTAYGFDLFHAGSTKFRFGSILGVPMNYEYSSVNEINKRDIVFRNEPIKWDSESGKLLQESIVFDEQEQIFSFCKSLLQLKSNLVLLNSIFPSVSFLTVYTIGRYLNETLNLYSRPVGMRFVLYIILSFFGFGTWMFMKDYTQVMSESDNDKKLSTLGPEFVEAGVRYYDKILKRNIALRNLIGDDTYTARGNENYLIRNKSLPLTIRKSFFESKLKEMQTKSEVLVEPEIYQ